MKRYQCHKVFEAAKIMSVVGGVVRLINEDGSGERVVDESWLSRFTPESSSDLGYLIRYEDGYLSWFPSKEFEEGHSLVNEEERR